MLFVHLQFDQLDQALPKNEKKNYLCVELSGLLTSTNGRHPSAVLLNPGTGSSTTEVTVTVRLSITDESPLKAVSK